MTREQFKSHRLSLGFTQAGLAAHWGMAATGERSVRRWEAGDVPVNPIAAFCLALMVDQDGAKNATTEKGATQ